MGEDIPKNERNEPTDDRSQVNSPLLSAKINPTDIQVCVEKNEIENLKRDKLAINTSDGPFEGNESSILEPIDVHSATTKLDQESINIISQNLTAESSNHFNLDPKAILDPLTSSNTAKKQLALQNFEDDINKCSPKYETDNDEKNLMSEDDKGEKSSSEIKNIINQFSEGGHGPGHEEVMSPRLGLASSLLGDSIQYPPRISSLEPLNSKSKIIVSTKNSEKEESQKISHSSDIGPAVPPKSCSFNNVTQAFSSGERYKALDTSISSSLHRPPPPEPESEPNIPFDFHRFLEQLRHKSADPVAKFLRSFLQEFGKKQWMVHEQVKIISDFLAFISNKMAQCDVWAELSDAEFDNAREGMEKLVMNRLYTQTFSPAILPPQSTALSKVKRKGTERNIRFGRRGQHQEDVERDEILAQKVGIYGWIKEQHLDIPPVSENGRNFLIIAKKELLKIKTYRAPRDKIICVLNCCKLIFGLLKHSKSDSSADSFMPLLIYVVLKANPEHLVSNVQYIFRFRNQEKLVGEVGYYLSSLLGAVHFIENLDRTTLTISDEDFEKNVEAAVSAISEKHQAQASESDKTVSELISQDHTTIRSLREFDNTSLKKQSSSVEIENSETPDEKAQIGGLLRTIQRPLSSIGWIFSDESSASQSKPPRIFQTEVAQRQMQPQAIENSDDSSSYKYMQSENLMIKNTLNDSENLVNSHDGDLINSQRIKYSNLAETLAVMFPDLDKEVIRDVVTQKEGMVGPAVDVCLALSSE